MIKEIRVFDPFNAKAQDMILRQETALVNDINDSFVQQCIKDLNDSLDCLINKYGCERGIGLSAPQIGYSLSISIIHNKEQRFVLINPDIIDKSPTIKLFRVGCFSFYQYRALVRYSDIVTVEYKNENWETTSITVKDDLALIFQHEIDHLHGVLSFDHLLHGEQDLFIPRIITTSRHVALKNYGIVFTLRQKLKKVQAISVEQYYSFLFNYSYNYADYVDNAVNKRVELFETIKHHSSNKSRILEAGCGTSSISIYLSKLGYSVDCIDNNENMLSLAKTMNQRVNGHANYLLGDICNMPFNDKSYDIVFSHGVLEHFNDSQKIDIIAEGLRVADKYIISVPTIWDISNNLLGDEQLWTVTRWKRLFSKHRFNILEVKKSFPTTPKIKKLNEYLDIFPSGNIIFVITAG